FKVGTLLSKNTSFMITKKELKSISSLRLKKNRKELGQFVAEGTKTVEALIESGLAPSALYATQESDLHQVTLVGQKDMERMTLLKNASPMLGLFSIPSEPSLPTMGRVLVLDAIADPGNLGTIIRLCDWFGIEHILCSEDTVDCYNPKVVQATMGSLARVYCHYTDLNTFLSQSDLPIYGTFLEGESIYETSFPENAMLVLGSESHGISPAIEALVTCRVTIPRKVKQGPESLNVAIAGALTLGEFCQ
ncbi:RNA methyltransferase, partial [Flavobacteriaceae bacterium]|nr:RNA methyltransferase [Flavobacteriaceae bacterium]